MSIDHLAHIPPDDEAAVLEPLTDTQRIRLLEAGHRLLVGQVASIGDRLVEGDTRMGALATNLALNTSATLEIRDVMAAAKGTFKVLSWIGVGVKWIGGVAGTVAALWALVDLLRHGPK